MEQENVMTGFEALITDSRILRALEDMAFEQPTEIQSQAIPLMRSGADIIARSQTGTGKTMAFAIPAIEKISTQEDKPTVQVLIMCPTRELALQCSEEIKKLTKYIGGIRPAEVYGGASMEHQITRLKRANIVIGTPGRIMDHMRRKTLKLDNVRLVVLDEADEMLSMGYGNDSAGYARKPSDGIIFGYHAALYLSHYQRIPEGSADGAGQPSAGHTGQYSPAVCRCADGTQRGCPQTAALLL